jgi:hypothetical protein
MAFARAINLGQAQCVFVEIKDLTLALSLRGYLKDQREVYDEEVAIAFEGWFAQSGLDPGWFGLQATPVGLSTVEICPGEAWQQLDAEATGVAIARESAPAAPAIPDVGLEPVPPTTPAPVVRAGFSPESSPWAWVFLAAVLGGTYLYVRYDRRQRR